MLKILDPNDARDASYCIQLHALRYQIFVKELGWQNGIIVKNNNEEYDDFDHPDARYIVNINDHGDVDAATRITHTNFPYLLDHAAKVYPGCVTHPENLPHSFEKIEVSRVCASKKTAPRDILGQLFVGIHEYGLKMGCDGGVSFSDERIVPLIKKFGWDCEAIGKAVYTGTDLSLGLKLPIDECHYEAICKLVNIHNDVFPQMPWPSSGKMLAYA